MAPAPSRNKDLPLEAHIARDILTRGVGGRLPTATEYQQTLEVGSGTIQRAIQELKNTGGVSLRARGHRGTYITEIQLPLVWEAAALEPIHLLLPPAASIEAQSIAGALAHAVETVAAARLTVGMMVGAGPRLESLSTHAADVVAMSSGAFADLTESHSANAAKVERVNDLVLLSLGSGSYYQEDSMVVVSRSPEPSLWRSVGVDPQSSDHQRLSHAEFGQLNAKTVDTSFPVIPRAVYEGEIDAGIWHVADSLIPLDRIGLTLTALSRNEARRVFAEVSAAVLIARADDPVGMILENLDADSLATDVATQTHAAGLPPFRIDR